MKTGLENQNISNTKYDFNATLEDEIWTIIYNEIDKMNSFSVDTNILWTGVKDKILNFIDSTLKDNFIDAVKTKQITDKEYLKKNMI